MNLDKKHWRPSPILVVLTTAVIVISVTMLLGWLNARRYRVTARVEIAEPISALEVSAPSASANALTLPDGEVARLALRVE